MSGINFDLMGFYQHIYSDRYTLDHKQAGIPVGFRNKALTTRENQIKGLIHIDGDDAVARIIDDENNKKIYAKHRGVIGPDYEDGPMIFYTLNNVPQAYVFLRPEPVEGRKQCHTIDVIDFSRLREGITTLEALTGLYYFLEAGELLESRRDVDILRQGSAILSQVQDKYDLFQ
ncbi:MAG: hypothetical protein KC535_01870 [Nanoarchaeota archaeon]|nr:hypothetical protein [Nanoarchaeota archaeon]